jgi:hypothetical protein
LPRCGDWQLEGYEELSRIEVIFPGLIDNTKVVVPRGRAVWQGLIHLPRLQIFFTICPDTQHKL